MKAVIAKFLNISTNAIRRVEEWANCFFVVASGIGGRFVSKKIMKKYVGDRNARRGEKNYFAKRQECRKDCNLILKANGFEWVKSEVLDIAQGEIGASEWSLVGQGKEWSFEEALEWCFSQPKANLIPRRGGKPKLISPDVAWNAPQFAWEYGLI